MTNDDDAIVGREQEIARLGGFLDSAGRGPAALVLEGEAGIGKTTLWRWTLATARGRGFTVLSASPAAAETALSFSALDDLLEPVLGDVLPRLPAPRRAALEAALLLSASHGAPEGHAIAAGLRDAIRVLGEVGPVLVAVDDAQWIDRPSAAVIAYALRRLASAPVGVLAARRSVTDAAVPFELDRAFDRCERLPVAELSLGALHQIIAGRLGLTLPRPLLRRIADSAGGNPFFALEIARALQRRGRMPGLADPLEVPDELHELLRDRLAALPAATRELLAVAAALSAPTSSLLETASGGGALELRAAVDAGLVAFAGERLRFTHPLLRSAALGLLLPGELRSLHRRLAAVVPDPEERARHLALSVDGPDATVAATLDEAATLAVRRGARHAAAELCELALRLTPDGAADAHERRLRAARLIWDTGDSVRALALSEQAVVAAPAGSRRAQALLELAIKLAWHADARAANAVLHRVLEESGDEAGARAAAHTELAINLFLLRESLPEAQEHARVAVELSERLGSPAQLVRALTNQGMVWMALGRADAEEPIARALGLEPALPDTALLRPQGRMPARDGPPWDRAAGLLWNDRLAEATTAWDAIMDAATAAGDDGSMPFTLAQLALTRCYAGDLTEAARLAEDGYELAVQSGRGGDLAMVLAVRAFIAAHRGDAAACRRLASEAIAAGERRAFKPAVVTARSALGLLALSLGEHALAAAELAELERETVVAGVGNPGGMRFIPDYTEALAGLGELDRARSVIDRYQAHAVRLDRPAARASALRCHGLIDAAAGDTDGALRAFAAAHAQHDRLVLPIDRARTLLAHGALLRRAKQKTAARASLDEAREVFTTTGAKLFAAATARELARIGGRAASPDGLTPSERRVAELVAEGQTNRQVAAALFVSERTVEGHLSRIYAKLGVRSRSQLARRQPTGHETP